MNSQMTPGQWHIHIVKSHPKAPPSEIQIRDEKQNVLLVTASYGSHAGAPLSTDVKLANAIAVAALPDCIAALRDLVDGLETGKGDWRNTDAARAALIKAGVK